MHVVSAFTLLCLAVWLAPLVFLRGSYDPSNLPKAAWIQVMAMIAWAVWARSKRSDATAPALSLAPYDIPLAALLAWSALSLSWSQRPYTGVLVWMTWAAAGLVYLLLGLLPLTLRNLERLLVGLFVAGTVVALVGLAQAAFGLAWIPQAYAPAATFANKNVAAGFVAAVLPLGAAALGRPGRHRLWLVTAGSVAIGAFVFAAMSRAAWLAVAAEALVFVALWLRRARPIVPKPAVHAAAACLALALLGTVVVGARGGLGRVGPHLAGLTGAFGSRNASVSPEEAGKLPASVVSVLGRRAIWYNTLAMVNDHPVVGVGLGNHAVHYPRYARRAAIDPLFGPATQLDYVHNDYLQVAAELGLPGLVLVAALVVGILLALRRIAAAPAEPEARALLLAATLGLVGLGVDALFGFPFQLAAPPLVLAVLLAVLRALLPAGGRAWRPRISRWLAPAAAAVAVGLVVLHGRWLRADQHCFRMFRAARQGDWVEAERHARRAAALDPSRTEPLYVLGEAYLITGRPQEAASAFEAVLVRTPNEGGALRNLATASVATGALDRAVAAAKAVVDMYPLDTDAQYRLGVTLLQKGDAAAAVGPLRQAAEQRPNDPSYRYRLGLAALRAGAYPEAEAALRAAITLAPDHALAHKALGVLLFDVLGRKDEGAPHLMRLLELAPQDRDAPHIRDLLAKAPGPRQPPL